MNNAETSISRDSDDTLDSVLRAELHWQAPPELTSRLLDLIPDASTTSMPQSSVAARPVYPRAGTWYARVVMLLTTFAVALSFLVTWQFYGIVSTELGLAEIWQQLQQAPTIGLAWLYEQLPVARSLVEVVTIIQGQLHWFLIAAVLWLVLDGWSTRSTLQSQQA